MCKRITLFAIITIALFICIPAFAQHFLGAFSGAELQVDTQIENPAQNNNAQTLPEQQAGDTIRFQLFVPAGAGQTTNGYALELDLPGKTFSSSVGTVSGRDWTGAALVSRGSKELSALFVTGATVPSTGYLGQVDLQVTQPLEDGATLIVKSMSLTSGRDVDQLDVSNAVISFTAPSASTCPGDFDGNEKVDIADFLSFVDVYGSSSSDATYNAQMDLDSNGSVDIADFLAFVDVYGTTCGSQPPPNSGSGGGGGSSGAITRMAFDTPRLLAGGYVQTTLELNISGVPGGPALFAGGIPGVSSQRHREASGMLLAKVKGCNFVANEVDRKSKVYIKVRPLVEVHGGRLRSETVCGVSSRTDPGQYSHTTTGITHLLFFDETSPTNMREAVYNDATGQYDMRVVDSLPAFINGTIYLAKHGWIQDRNHWIQRLNLDGFNLEMLIHNHPRAMYPSNVSLDVNGGKMYWIADRGIHRANLNGSNIEELVPQQEYHRTGFTLDADRGKIYWSENNRIYRANLDGSNIELFSLDPAHHIAVGRDKIYYLPSGDVVKRINLDGSGPEDIAGRPKFREHYTSIAVDTTNSKIYIGVRHWGPTRSFNYIAQANLDGSEWKEFFIGANSGSIRGIEVDSKQGKIYYLTSPSFGDGYQILCAELTGDNPQILYHTKNSQIALDASR